MWGQLDPSCCCCLLHITHLAPETSRGTWKGWDGGARRSSKRASCCRSRPRPPCCLPPGAQRAAPRRTGLARELGNTQRLSRPEVTRSGKERAARKPTATSAYRSQEKWKKKAKNLERSRYSKHYNPNRSTAGKSRKGKQSPHRKKAPE